MKNSDLLASDIYQISIVHMEDKKMNNNNGKLYIAGKNNDNEVEMELKQWLDNISSTLTGSWLDIYNHSPISCFVGNILDMEFHYKKFAESRYHGFITDGPRFDKVEWSEDFYSDLSRLKPYFLNREDDFMMTLFRAEIKEQVRLLSFEEAFEDLQQWMEDVFKDYSTGKTLNEALSLHPYTVSTLGNPGKRGEISFKDLLLRRAKYYNKFSSVDELTIACRTLALMYILTMHSILSNAKHSVYNSFQDEDYELIPEKSLSYNSADSDLHRAIDKCTTFRNLFLKPPFAPFIRSDKAEATMRLADSLAIVDLWKELRDEGEAGAKVRPFFLDRLKKAEVR